MCRALNQRSKRVWLLHVGESNFGGCRRRFGGKAIRAAHAGDNRHRRGTQIAQNITARLPACSDEKNRILDACSSHDANRRSSSIQGNGLRNDRTPAARPRPHASATPSMWDSLKMHRGGLQCGGVAYRANQPSPASSILSHNGAPRFRRTSAFWKLRTSAIWLFLAELGRPKAQGAGRALRPAPLRRCDASLPAWQFATR